MAVMTENDLQVPDAVLEALKRVQESARTNMLDYKAVLELVWLKGKPQAHAFLKDHPRAYMDILNAFGAWLEAGGGDGDGDDDA